MPQHIFGMSRKKVAAILGGSALIVCLAVLALVWGGDGSSSELAQDADDTPITSTTQDGTSNTDPDATTASTRVGSSATQAPLSPGFPPGSPRSSSSPGSNAAPPSQDSPNGPGLPVPKLPIPDPTGPVIEVLCTVQERAAIDEAVDSLRDDLLGQEADLVAQIDALEAQVDTLLGGNSLHDLLNGLLGILNPQLKAQVEGLLDQIDALEAELVSVRGDLDDLVDLAAEAIELCEAGGDGLSLL